MNKLIITTGLVLATLAFAVSAFAFTMPTHPNADRLQPGTHFTSDVDTSAYAGQTCVITGANGESTHAGTTIAFTSDGHTATLVDAEAKAFATVTADQPLVLGNSVHVDILAGRDPNYNFEDGGNYGFSFGDATFTCTAPPTITTTSPLVTPPVVPPTPAVPVAPPTDIVTIAPPFTG